MITQHSRHALSVIRATQSEKVVAASFELHHLAWAWARDKDGEVIADQHVQDDWDAVLGVLATGEPPAEGDGAPDGFVVLACERGDEDDDGGGGGGGGLGRVVVDVEMRGERIALPMLAVMPGVCDR
ncbi:hypothetical protein HC256_005446 [Beauveria bassiana]|nr:hypothetical protein HC256_005446 [Beauveria bassiana]